MHLEPNWPLFWGVDPPILWVNSSKIWDILVLGMYQNIYIYIIYIYCVCMLVVVVPVLIAYDYDFARKLWASRPFGGEAGLAHRESLQLRPCWPNIEPQMIERKEEKKLRCEARFADQAAAPKTSPQKAREQIVGPEIDPRFWGQRIRGVCICPASWPRRQKHDSRSLRANVAKRFIALCPLWWFQPPILQHVLSCALYIFNKGMKRWLYYTVIWDYYKQYERIPSNQPV